MAVTLKRKRGAVSYKEPSSDDDLSMESSDEISPRKRRIAPSRRSARHHLNEQRTSPPKTRHTATRGESHNDTNGSRGLRRQRKVSYRDISSDDESDGDFEDEQDRVSTTQERPRPKAARSSRPHKKRTSPDQSRRALGAPLKLNTPKQLTNPTKILSDGVIPAWASLPYHILLQVFVYASHPLHDENMVRTYISEESGRQTSYIAWLVQMARVCSTFTKPALTALYRNPPIFASKLNRKDLVHHLASPPPGAHEDYQVMVKRLELDGTKMGSFTDPTNNVADLTSLMTSLTTMKEIDIFDPIDRPPYRERLRRVRRWHYPEELFAAMRQTELRLKSWRWNSSFCEHGPIWIKEIHEDKAFQSLRELSLTKFHSDLPRKSDEGQPTTEELLGSAIAILPNLRSLNFESCTVVNGRLFPLLPSKLVNLNITNCRDLTSEVLQGFLTTQGRQLEELVLNHNQSLDLSFLVNLKSSCPRLEVLRMDMTYYSSLTMSADNEPLYDYLLGEDEIPTWPSTLRIIDMEYLRNWDSAAATNFFSSLIEAAEDLPWLRELVIVAMVNADWRQRAEFRKKWTAIFMKVFARQWVAPSPHLVSLKAFREWKASQDEDGDKNDSFISGVSEEAAHKEATESDSDAPLLPLRRQKHDEKWNSKRLRCRAKATANYDETSENESVSEGASDGEEINCIQGRCHTVVFRLDNLRPSEQILDEADFLDAEPSGDEDWNGNDDVDEGEYAW